MMYYKNILYSLIILFVCIVLRVKLIHYPQAISLYIMSAINAIAMAVVLVSIVYKTYKLIKIKQIWNEAWRKYLIISSLFLIAITSLYVCLWRNSVINDILTIIALILSIQDEAYSNLLFHFYSIFYKKNQNRKIDNFLNSI